MCPQVTFILDSLSYFFDGSFSMLVLLVSWDTEATSEVIYPIPKLVLKEKGGMS